MCADYTPSTNFLIGNNSIVASPQLVFPSEVWPGYMPPFCAAHTKRPVSWKSSPPCSVGPHWADHKLARQTYNARTETVASNPSFRSAWKRKQLCIIPAANFFEPNYETGKSVRWRIESADGGPVAIAGI